MNFFANLNQAILYGGRNEDMIERGGYFDNIFVLKLVPDLVWIKCTLLGQNLPPRANHQSFTYGSQLFVFGGNNQNGFLSSQMQVLDIDQDKMRDALRQIQIQEELD